MLGNSLVAAQLVACQEGLNSMELVSSSSFCRTDPFQLLLKNVAWQNTQISAN
jgi:hypothetical protein